MLLFPNLQAIFMHLMLAVVLLLALFAIYLLAPPIIFGINRIKIVQSIAHQHYNTLATHVPSSTTFTLYAKTWARMFRPESLTRAVGHSHKFDVPPTPGIYDVSWARGLRRAQLVVNSDITNPQSAILVIVPDFTWQAYNLTGGRNLYSAPGVRVSIDRPLEELFSRSFARSLVKRISPLHSANGMPQYHDPAYNPIGFITASSSIPDVISQSALLDNYSDHDLSHYSLLVLYGHDEYWPLALSRTIRNAVLNGTNLLNMSGNTHWWQTIYTERQIERTEEWYKHPDGPEENMLGLSFRFAGYPISRKLGSSISDEALSELRAQGFPTTIKTTDATKMTNGFRVLNKDDPLYTDTGLSTGDWFGVDSGLNHLETDGWPIGPADSIDPSISSDAGGQPTLLAESWTYRMGKIRHSASVVRHTYGKGKVISFGTIGWTKAILANDKTVRQITKNALEELLEQ